MYSNDLRVFIFLSSTYTRVATAFFISLTLISNSHSFFLAACHPPCQPLSATNILNFHPLSNTDMVVGTPLHYTMLRRNFWKTYLDGKTER